MSAILRFAPSPNGRLHLGHAYSALLNAAIAERMQGQCLLRIEDIDTTRCTEALAQACIDDLHWLGLRWPEPVRVQSRHLDAYAAALGNLKDMGLVYPCFCSRRTVADAAEASDPEGAPLYPGTCRHLPPDVVAARMQAGMPHSWRLKSEEAIGQAGPLAYTRFMPHNLGSERIPVEPARWGDVILARKDIGTSYHIAVVVDDAGQGITHVVRGKDLEAATDIHVLLQHVLGLPTPYYHHHRLLTDEEGGKLAKSKASRSLAEMRGEGVTAPQLRTMLDALVREA